MRKRQAPEGLILRGKVWYAKKVVRVGSATERIRETTGLEREQVDQAKAWLRRRISEVERALLYGPPPDDHKPQVPGFATAAADYAERGGRRGPLGKQDVAKLTALAKFFGEKPCDEIGEDDWDDFVAAHLATCKPDTERRWFSMLRAPLGRALRKARLALPEFDIPPASAGRSPPFLHPATEKRLLAAYAPHAQPIARLLAWQGCREMEALRLQIADVDLDAETITFRETKNGEPRVVPMDERVAPMLRSHIGKREVGPVFLTPAGVAYNDRRAASHGAGLDGGGIRTAHRRACERAGVAGFRIHDWRHHFAVMYLVAGGKETALMAICGWKDRRMIDRYVKLPLDHLRNTLRRGTSKSQQSAPGS